MTTHTRDALNGAGSRVAQTVSSGLEITEIGHLISNERRVYVLEALAYQESIEFGELVNYVCEQEYGREMNQIDDDEKQRVRVSLMQSHLEPLFEQDVIDYRDKTGTIRQGSQFETILEFVKRDSRSIVDRVVSLF